MATRTKLQRTRFFLDELKYSIKNILYNQQTGGVRLYQLSEILIDETYNSKSEKIQAKALWNSIDEIFPNYKGKYLEKISNNINNTNSRV